MNGRNHYQHQLDFPATEKQEEYSKESKTGKLGSYRIMNQDVQNILRDYPRFAPVKTEVK